MTGEKLIQRRYFLAALGGGLAASHAVQAAGVSLTLAEAKRYHIFLQGVRQQALALGIPKDIVDAALALAKKPNQNVLRLDRHQPEFTLTWAQYRERVLGAARLSEGQKIYRKIKHVVVPLSARYRCDSAVIMGIWGLESGFGVKQGRYNVIDALATLAFDGRRTPFFRSELMNAFKILAMRKISPSALQGSYAGAMGQVQFMPSAYLKYGVDGSGDRRCDIWNTPADVFASIANYLSNNGWRRGEPWGEEVAVPLGINGHFVTLGAQNSRYGQERPVAEWSAMGVRPVQNKRFVAPQGKGVLLQPDGPGGQAFLVYRNFHAIRTYNPSDYYALAVGMLGDKMALNLQG